MERREGEGDERQARIERRGIQRTKREREVNGGKRSAISFLLSNQKIPLNRSFLPSYLLSPLLLLFTDCTPSLSFSLSLCSC